MPDDALPLMNVYVFTADDGQVRHLLALQEPVLAGEKGVEPRSIIGEVTPNDYGGYDPLSLLLNPAFVEAIGSYMNEVVAETPEIAEQARAGASNWVLVVDPRNHDQTGVAPHPTDVVGGFVVDESGRIVPGSFEYNIEHNLLDTERGMSGLFSDRRFYDWLHATHD